MPLPIPRLILVGLLIGAASCLAGCEKPGTPARGSLEYTANAKRDYERALDKFFAHDWEEAVERFTEVKRNYGYTRYARLAELRIADCQFHQKDYPEAVTTYRAFVHDHPNDPEVPYARFRAAEALYEDASPALLLAPLEERDLVNVLDAYQTLRAFAGDFPAYERHLEVEFMLRTVTGVLARNDLYVARFYLQRRRYETVLARIDHALTTYGGSDLTPEALVLRGETYLRMRRPEAARKAFETVVHEHADSAFVPAAQRFLDRLGAAPNKE
ncbi:MAG: tetratricopeptide repeat protein [Polyangiaceae bacterium]|nr:tetratricopeptide repeat protein [Polyangiaceae bacterium]